MSKPVCAVIGVGPGHGTAIARNFSSEGYTGTPYQHLMLPVQYAELSACGREPGRAPITTPSSVSMLIVRSLLYFLQRCLSEIYVLPITVERVQSHRSA
jgi:hypothetical protein